jgi:hypothetical protein
MTDPKDCAYPADIKTHTHGGLTKREYFAAMALQGLAAGAHLFPPEILSRNAVKMADALIKELNKTA